MLRKVCHVTSVHKPTDARIFERECSSLTKCYDVTLIAPNVEDYEQNGVHVKGVRLPESRLKRHLSLNRVYKKMKEVDADIYHFHDPELMALGLNMKKEGKKVIFDSHEDIPSQIKNKTYIPTRLLRSVISSYYEFFEKKSLKQYDAVVSVTPEIVDRLKKINPNTIMLTNYPIYNDSNDNRTWEKKIGFAGLISRNWNLHHVLEAIKDMDVVFELAGPCYDCYLDELKTMPGWEKVNYHGVIKHQKVFDMLKSCSAGMAVSTDKDPNINYKQGSIGVTKIFEYMLVGIPVIATNLYSWIPIIEGNKCGYCLDCNNVDQIRKAILDVLNHPDEAEQMGNHGKAVVKNKYCWQEQEKTLFDMYSQL